jgi:hypothetical protein
MGAAGSVISYRFAILDDCPVLAELNHQLIRDEGHRNQMTVPELDQRMRGWLTGEYQAVIYEDGGEVVAYALFREEAEEIYLRQLFVVRTMGRCSRSKRQGFEGKVQRQRRILVHQRCARSRIAGAIDRQGGAVNMRTDG